MRTPYDIPNRIGTNTERVEIEENNPDGFYYFFEQSLCNGRHSVPQPRPILLENLILKWGQYVGYTCRPVGG